MPRHPHVRRYLTAFDTGRVPQVFADVVVLGSGVAALRAAMELAPGLRVALLTKSGLTESNSYYAQGGIAAAIDEADSIQRHMADTLETGCGLSDEAVVRQVVGAAPGCIRELIDWGASFDQENGRISVGREGGHSASRILHARGDETGKEITSTLLARVIRHEAVDLYENTIAIDLLTVDGAVVGVLAWNQKHGPLVVRARRTVLASGGLGRIYRESTNPEVATGDGLAMAYRAGAVLADLEFVQFHPTTLYIAGASRHLISETVRGEGGRLVDKTGRAFMADYHPMGDLAPRDVVSRAILDHMRRTGAAYVYLDLTGLGESVRDRFPGIATACSQFDIDIARDRIPVRPSAHYMIGGVRADTVGRTSLENLSVCGEAASTWLHGANRLGSNSLLEGLVYGRAVGRRIADELAGDAAPDARNDPGAPERIRSNAAHSTRGQLHVPDVRDSLRALMWRNVGIVRTGDDLAEADSLIAFWQSYVLDKVFDQPGGWELQNMLTVGRLMIEAALARTETRGVHHRSDFPDRDDVRWAKHILVAHDRPPWFEPASGSRGDESGAEE
ncbi:MAG: L-aspartate oxidase [Planctomycetes bacterium]|nr:L-aspartate oxidase [Planctomycetota bacterium]